MFLCKCVDNYFSETTKVYIAKQADNLASNAIKDVILEAVVPYIDKDNLININFKKKLSPLR
jgi:hypothetical protein